MKTMKLSFAALALCAFSATGCIFVSDDDPIEPTQGVFHATWTLTQGGAAVTCTDVAAASTSFLSTRASDSMGFDDIFDCADLAGDTVPLTIDDYAISVSILDANDAVLGQIPNPLEHSFVTDLCDTVSADGDVCTINLPNVEFQFSP
jgi:hypothetical protein